MLQTRQTYQLVEERERERVRIHDSIKNPANCSLLVTWFICFAILQDRITDLNKQARKFVQEQHFDAENIQEKQRLVNDRYQRY